MRILVTSLFLALAAGPLFAQRMASHEALFHAHTAESAVSQAIRQLAEGRKLIERDLEVLGHLQGSEEALADAMQPHVALQKALHEVQEAQRKGSDVFEVRDGIIRARQELEDANRSPTSADFDHLRTFLRTEALDPASRVAARNALRLEEETLAWIKVQEMIATQLRALSELAGESLRAAQK